MTIEKRKIPFGQVFLKNDPSVTDTVYVPITGGMGCANWSTVRQGTVHEKKSSVNVIKTKIVKKSVFEFSLLYFSQSLRYFSILTYNYVRTYGTLRHICKQLTSNNICMIWQQLFQTVNDHQFLYIHIFLRKKSLSNLAGDNSWM